MRCCTLLVIRPNVFYHLARPQTDWWNWTFTDWFETLGYRYGFLDPMWGRHLFILMIMSACFCSGIYPIIYISFACSMYCIYGTKLCIGLNNVIQLVAMSLNTIIPEDKLFQQGNQGRMGEGLASWGWRNYLFKNNI